jgi:hypothetical protein
LPSTVPLVPPMVARLVAVVEPVAADDAVDEPVVLLEGGVGEAVPAAGRAAIAGALGVEARVREGDGDAAGEGAVVEEVIAADGAAEVGARPGRALEAGVGGETLRPDGGAAAGRNDDAGIHVIAHRAAEGHGRGRRHGRHGGGEGRGGGALVEDAVRAAVPQRRHHRVDSGEAGEGGIDEQRAIVVAVLVVVAGILGVDEVLDAQQAPTVDGVYAGSADVGRRAQDEAGELRSLRVGEHLLGYCHGTRDVWCGHRCAAHRIVSAGRDGRVDGRPRSRNAPHGRDTARVSESRALQILIDRCHVDPSGFQLWKKVGEAGGDAWIVSVIIASGEDEHGSACDGIAKRDLCREKPPR